MKMWAVASILFVFMGTLLFIIFVLFNFLFVSPDVGLIPAFNESAVSSMNSDYYGWFLLQMDQTRALFGITGVVFFLLAILLYVVESSKEMRRAEL